MLNAKKQATSFDWWQYIIGIIFFIIAFTFAFNVGIARQEKADCYKWQSWDKAYILFEPSQDMTAHCGQLGIDLKN